MFKALRQCNYGVIVADKANVMLPVIKGYPSIQRKTANKPIVLETLPRTL